jgi:hypothetical protein
MRAALTHASHPHDLRLLAAADERPAPPAPPPPLGVRDVGPVPASVTPAAPRRPSTPPPVRR